MLRYRFGDFVLSPRRRILLRDGREVPLIPRYFDLLVFLVEHRHEAVHRRDIFDHVWSDVIVSDSALSQAIRTIRRALGDDSREPRFVRTVSRHGYRFVAADVLEEMEEGQAPQETAAVRAIDPGDASAAFEPLLERLTATTDPADPAGEADEALDAAERLHALGTADALRRLGTRPHHEEARARLRDARWSVPDAGDVPLLGQPGAARAVVALVRLRLRRAARPVAGRWFRAALGSGLAGAAAGGLGGALLNVLASEGSPGIIPVLALLGLGCGGIGGAGVAGGLEVAEAVVRSRRVLALTIGAALGGACVGTVVQWMARWSLTTLVGVDFFPGGGLEGLVIGGAAGLGYGLCTRRSTDGLASPRGRRRTVAVIVTAVCCGLAALALALSGRPLVGGTLHLLADHAQGAQTSLAPLGRLLGEPGFGALTSSLIAFGEGAVFGLGLALGLTRRARRSRTAHTTLTST